MTPVFCFYDILLDHDTILTELLKGFLGFLWPIYGVRGGIFRPFPLKLHIKIHNRCLSYNNMICIIY